MAARKKYVYNSRLLSEHGRDVSSDSACSSSGENGEHFTDVDQELDDEKGRHSDEQFCAEDLFSDYNPDSDEVSSSDLELDDIELAKTGAFRSNTAAAYTDATQFASAYNAADKVAKQKVLGAHWKYYERGDKMVSYTQYTHFQNVCD